MWKETPHLNMWERYPRTMLIELTRFRVLPGRRALVDEWLAFLNSNMDAVRETLDVETIFVETIDGVDYLYWYSVQGEQGATLSVSDSPHWLDQKHVHYWRECIDPTYEPQQLTPRVHMVPERVQAAMKPKKYNS